MNGEIAVFNLLKAVENFGVFFPKVFLEQLTLIKYYEAGVDLGGGGAGGGPFSFQGFDPLPTQKSIFGRPTLKFF